MSESASNQYFPEVPTNNGVNHTTTGYNQLIQSELNNHNIPNNEMASEWNNGFSSSSVMSTNGVQNSSGIHNQIGVHNVNDTQNIHHHQPSHEIHSHQPNYFTINIPRQEPYSYNSIQNISQGINNAVASGRKKPKRIRTAFTSNQMVALEREYAKSRYLDRPRRLELAGILHLHERTIKIWFQNRRMKEKKDREENFRQEEVDSTASTPSFLSALVPANGQNFQNGTEATPSHTAVSGALTCEHYPVRNMAWVLDEQRPQQTHARDPGQFDSGAVFNGAVPHPLPSTVAEMPTPGYYNNNTTFDTNGEVMSNGCYYTNTASNVAVGGEVPNTGPEPILQGNTSEVPTASDWDISWLRSCYGEDEFK